MHRQLMAPSVMNLHRFIITVLLISLSGSYALKCYQCDTEIHKGDCPEEGSEIKPKYIVECKGSCHINSYWVFGSKNERKCSAQRPTNECNFSWIGETCYCNTDLCNREA